MKPTVVRIPARQADTVIVVIRCRYCGREEWPEEHAAGRVFKVDSLCEPRCPEGRATGGPGGA